MKFSAYSPVGFLRSILTNCINLSSSLASSAFFIPLINQGKISSSYFLPRINISRPVEVVQAAISRLHTGDVPAPNCPYNELAVTFNANCFASYILALKGFSSASINFLTALRSFNSLSRINGITPSLLFFLAYLRY